MTFETPLCSKISRMVCFLVPAGCASPCRNFFVYVHNECIVFWNHATASLYSMPIVKFAFTICSTTLLAPRTFTMVHSLLVQIVLSSGPIGVGSFLFFFVSFHVFSLFLTTEFLTFITAKVTNELSYFLFSFAFGQLPDHMITHPPVLILVFGTSVCVTGAVRTAPVTMLPFAPAREESHGWFARGTVPLTTEVRRTTLRAWVCSHQRLQPLGRSSQQCLFRAATAD